ncbi:MAG: hypothetical protein Q9206_007273, partial [Seirophora lacunosa]
MSTSTASLAFALLVLLLIGLVVLLLLRHFLPIRSTPAYVLVPIFLALFLPVSVILLLPIDLASSLRSEDEATRGIWLPAALVLVAWRITYWLTFILPLLGEYIDSGYRTPKDRFIYSLRSNGRYQLIVLAYCWGLIFAIYLMGHGLVAVPRRLYRNASVSTRLRNIQSQAPGVHERFMHSNIALEHLESQLTQLRQRKNGISRDHQEWIEEIADGSDLPEARLLSTNTQTSNLAIPAVITDRYLAELARKLNRARHKRLRFDHTWQRLLRDAEDTQAIIDASASKRLNAGASSPHSYFLERLQVLTPYTRYLLYTHVLPKLQVILAAVLALASVFIVWSELVKYAAPNLSIIRFTVVSTRDPEDGQVHFAGQIMAALWMCYMCTCALASFGDVKVWGNRALVRRNTYGESATWYAGQVAKLTVPLAYNFLTFLPPAVHRETTFYRFLGQLINLTPLGKGFDFFFPIFILVPVCATMFNLYGRVKGVFRFDIVDDNDDNDDQSPSSGTTATWREGRALIERELKGSAATPRLPSTRNTVLDSPHPPFRDSASSPPPARRPGLASSAIPPPSSQRQPPSRLAAATAAAEQEDETFFQGFAHRVRNTIDTIERPDWVGKRPKWMGGVEGNEESSARAEAGRG